MMRSRRTWLRYALAALCAAVVAYLFWPLVDELRGATALLRSAHWPWLAAAAVLELIGYTCLAALNYWLLRPFSGRISLGRMMAVLPAMAFIEVAVPSAGASGVVLRGRLLNHNGYTLEASTFTLALETLFEIAVRGVVMVVGVWFLLAHGELDPMQVTLLAGGVGLLGVVLVVSWRRLRDPAWVEPRLVRLIWTWNRAAKHMGRAPFALEALRPRLRRFYAGLAQVQRAPLGGYVLLAGGHVALDIAALGACFLAFGHPVPLGTLLMGYSLTLLLSGLASLPGGLALTEASLAVVFSRLGVPGEVAIAAALVYRLIAFWLLRLIGFVCWQALEAQHERRTADSPTL